MSLPKIPCELTIGIGMWKETATIHLISVPHVQESITLDGDETFIVASVTIAPHKVYINCVEHFADEADFKLWAMKFRNLVKINRGSR